MILVFGASGNIGGELISILSANSAPALAVLLDFLQSTYGAAARLGQWDREALECRSTERSCRP